MYYYWDLNIISQISTRNTTGGTRKYPYPTQGRSLGILSEGGSDKESMKPNWNFPKELQFVGYGYFLEQRNLQLLMDYFNVSQSLYLSQTECSV